MRTLFRVFVASWRQLIRHAWVSFATLTAFCLALISLQALMGLQILAEQVVHEAEQRVDMTVTFKPATPEAVLSQAQSYIVTLPQTADVQVTTAAQALEQFRARHQANDQVLSALTEVGRNPLGARFVVRAKSLEDYPALVQAIQAPSYSSWIQGQSYRDHQETVQQLQSIRRMMRIIGSAMVLFFALIGLLMAFNAVRVAVFTQRDEIMIMRLVGASRFYIRTPFVLATLWTVLIAVAVTAGFALFAQHAFEPWLAAHFTAGATGLNTFMDQYGVMVLIAEVVGLSFATMMVSGIAVGKYIKR